MFPDALVTDVAVVCAALGGRPRSGWSTAAVSVSVATGAELIAVVYSRFGVAQDVDLNPVEHSMREVDAASRWFARASSKLHEATGDGLTGGLNSIDVDAEVNAGGYLTDGRRRLLAELKARFGSCVRMTNLRSLPQPSDGWVDNPDGA